MASSDRRSAPRHAVQIPIDVWVGNDMVIHATADLSAGGAFFNKAIPWGVGVTVTLRIYVPGESPVVCGGEIVNVPDRKNFGMGVKFTTISEQDQARLAAFAARNDARGEG